jgi:hypothetical protein
LAEEDGRILDSALKKLDLEEVDDGEMRAHYTNRWNR